MKEEIFSKFKDYNNELEKILEKKDFSKESKNLLLSMLYKVDISYNDYEIVKRDTMNKQEYLENILNNIKQCNSLELIKPNTTEFQKFKEKDILYDVDLKLKKIKVIDIELYLLSAIFELNDFRIYLNEDYNLIRNSFPYLLNTANDMNNTEVLRDFNGFSWNTNIKEINNIYVKLVYENLRIALDIDLIEKIKNTNKLIDVIEIIKQNLVKNYGEEVANEFLNLLFKLSILIYTKESENEKKRLLDERKVTEEGIEQIKDKKKYIEDIINSKMDLANKVKEIDLILNDKKLLKQEFERRNNTLSTYRKIFNLSHLTEKLQKERIKLLEQIRDCDKKLEPKQYVNDKNKLKLDYNLLKDIENESDKIIYKYIDKLQILFLEKIMPRKIDIISEKEGLVNLAYKLRYYEFVNYNQNQTIKDIIKFKELNTIVQEKLIKKMYALRIINTISTNEKLDINIVMQIFDLRMICLENIYFELRKLEDKNYQLNIYDNKETMEKSISIKLDFSRKDKVKLKRKVKLF